MATSTSNIGLIESVQEALINRNVRDYFPEVTTNYFTGLKKGDTAKVTLIAGSAGQYHKTNNNYFTGSGSVTGVDIVLNRHALQSFSIDQELRDKVAYDATVKAAVDAVMKEITKDIWEAFNATNFTNTASTVGLLSSCGYDKITDVFAIADLAEMETSSVAIKSSYLKKLYDDSNVASAFAFEGKMLAGMSRPTLLGHELVKTERIPAAGNVVGAVFAPESLVIAFGSPTADTGIITEVADDVTGFRLYVREVRNEATGETVIAVEAVYGIAVGIGSKCTLLKSA